MWTTIGARLLNLFFRNLVCMSAFYNAFALVGGGFAEDLLAGLWCWTMNNTSSNVAINIGARLIILRYSLWDLMCFVQVFFSLYVLLLLSAVDMIMVCRLACGIGIAGRTRVVLTLTSVLDLLYLKYTLRDLVCWLGLN